MTREQLNSMIPFMQAWINKEPIQWRYKDNPLYVVWRDFVSNIWTMDGIEFRHKPRECWANVFRGNPLIYHYFDTKELADRYASTYGERIECIHMKEVV